MTRLRALGADPRIILRDEELDRAGMLGLIAAADAFVSLHRSEGFGRDIAEAMLLGTPMIATAWSGPADFLDAGTGWPVDYRLLPIGREDDHGSAGQHWAEPDIDHAAALLREVARDPEEAHRRAARALALIRRRHGAQPAARGLLGAVGLRPMLDWQAPRDWAA
jgi:glycosyltransferase involved in cell wall biosynthesis